MSTLTPTRKVSRRHELREDKVVTFYTRVLGFIENNRNLVYGLLIGAVVIVALFFGYSYMQSNRNSEALALMSTAVAKYEAGEYDAALDGDMSFAGLLEVAEDFGNTTSGNLARFYAADASFRTGRLDRALEFFQSYDKGANFLGASALAGEAAIYETNDDHPAAADLYLRAANLFTSAVTSPDYLQKAAREYQVAGENAAARRVYLRLQEDFPTSSEAQNVDYFLAQIGDTQ